MIKIGIIGFDAIDIFDLQYLLSLDFVDVVGCYVYHDDQQNDNRKTIGNKVKMYTSFRDLIDNCDGLICYYNQHPASYSIVLQALKLSRHVFIKNPFSIKPSYLRQFIDYAKEADVVINLDQKHRYNPVFKEIAPYIEDPRFIRIEQIERYSETNSSLALINQKLIADLDIVLSILRNNVRKINANGVSVDGYTHDILNTSIEFDNGCVVNILKSRLSETSLYEMGIFQQNNTISVDFFNHKVSVTNWTNNKQGERNNKNKNVPIDYSRNHQFMGVYSFCETIKNDGSSFKAIEDFYAALQLAENIFEKIKLVTNEV